MSGLKLAPLPRPRADDPKLATRVFGLNFPNPVGIAPGFDKNAEVPDALFRLGFGFVEIGTVTPRPQTGNPRPRIFRLDADEAVINRLGFNNDGEAAVLPRLAQRANEGGIVGVNIGANRDSPDRVADYVRLIEVFAPVASYFTVNVSSPNTPGLRDLQRAAGLDDLLARVIEMRDRMRERAGPTPLLLKIAPDLSLSELDDIVGVARARKVDGMIVSNTTLSRPPSLREREKSIEQGGLSGRPLFTLSTRMLAETYVRTEGAFPLIGVGGIDSGEDGGREDQGRRQPGAALHRAGVQGPRACLRDQGRRAGGDGARAASQARGHGRRRCRRHDRRAVAGLAEELASARRVDEAHDQPDRDHDHGAEQEIAPHPGDRVEAHFPDAADDRCRMLSRC